MALNSFVFLLLFLPAVSAIVFWVRDRFGQAPAQVALLLASLAFYAFDGVFSFVLLVASISVNWIVGRGLASVEWPQARRKQLLLAGLVINVGVLCVFKYLRATQEFILVHTGSRIEIPSLGFPLGLSFFTLTQVMYLVDCYEKLVKPRRWLEHATFVSFFPNITAGPLLRSRLFFSQVESLGSAIGRRDRVSASAALIALGLVKKVVFGDSFKQLADAGYKGVGHLSTLEAWITTLAGTFEVYFDFSGYSDMAFGCAGIFGLTLVRNFNVPYRSATISEFWKRWHISLSDFITTYLYTPMLRSMGKATLGKSAVATTIAMLIAGVWHGASWNYVLFGLMHGVALAAFQYWKRRKTPLPRAVAIVVTFVFVNIVFITVRAADVGMTLTMARSLFPGAHSLGLDALALAIAPSTLRVILLPVALGSIAAFVGPTAEEISLRFRPLVRFDLLLIVLLLVAYVYTDSGALTQFRYRQF